MRIIEVFAAVTILLAVLAVAPHVDDGTATSSGSVTFVTRSANPYAPPPPPQAPEELARRVELHLLELVNGTRAEHGLPPLDWSAELADEARTWSATMLAIGRIEGEGATDSVAGVEGLVRSSTLHQRWVDDDAARSRMLDPDATSVGIGVVCTPAGGTYVTQRIVTAAAPAVSAPARPRSVSELMTPRWRPGPSCFTG